MVLWDRDVQRPTYDDGVRDQLTTAGAGTLDPTDALSAMLNNADTWEVV